MNKYNLPFNSTVLRRIRRCYISLIFMRFFFNELFCRSLPKTGKDISKRNVQNWRIIITIKFWRYWRNVVSDFSRNCICRKWKLRHNRISIGFTKNGSKYVLFKRLVSQFFSRFCSHFHYVVLESSVNIIENFFNFFCMIFHQNLRSLEVNWLQWQHCNISHHT